MSEELKAKNCPKCGKEADEIFYEFDQPRTGRSDNFCICHGGDSGYDLVVWNKRYEDNSQNVKEALEKIDNLKQVEECRLLNEGDSCSEFSRGFIKGSIYAFNKIKVILEGGE